ncbi:MAG TPA: hypothetical protein VK858_12430 [Longimicrobiales bacterium]|nr:hypothetical protein [Longimicrobiales bacterium]
MNVLLFGATGMIGSGVLTECLEDAGVGAVVAVGRSATGRTHPKLREVLLPDLFALATRRDELGPVDACLYCLGVSSTGMTADRYRTLTVDLTAAVADVVEGLAPECSFCFVSGQGSGSGRAMWARVKGEAEQAMLARPFDTWVFRPGFVQPVKGETSRTALYRYLYRIIGPVSPLIMKAFPGSVTTTEILARAMIRAARDGYPERILENPDINALGA